jgi:hypothetical protein
MNFSISGSDLRKLTGKLTLLPAGKGGLTDEHTLYVTFDERSGRINLRTWKSTRRLKSFWSVHILGRLFNHPEKDTLRIGLSGRKCGPNGDLYFLARRR